jgi:hypothetical protein
MGYCLVKGNVQNIFLQFYFTANNFTTCKAYCAAHFFACFVYLSHKIYVELLTRFLPWCGLLRVAVVLVLGAPVHVGVVRLGRGGAAAARLQGQGRVFMRQARRSRSRPRASHLLWPSAGESSAKVTLASWPRSRSHHADVGHDEQTFPTARNADGRSRAAHMHYPRSRQLAHFGH